MGFVLFLALATLSVLNQGVEFIQTSLASEQQALSKPVSRPLIRNQAAWQPVAYQLSKKRPESRRDGARTVIRESTDFLNSVRHLSRALIRLGQ
ncbi:MAG: hypothetical protein COV74_00210 [Candidatus Omnitrophica bacterium CG11_big_fil_rev_8_21_14_0_20_45_26]|uniref:Uncharacterized protein n=1 Tax=Candidatus Abzuiibacterium crystallinum TaxID=1974748 RepID=A0A2H0LSY1_9BACT|nr:MAG: hypothetical protein COV74_00210 [Candidatus Omnitrophica bacterium CG11_big_fil_rev_8_21_14_0_20_45_26]PIW64784.1 MAG: hypothetical protein COW12_04595 [Candidatus Omnitrophica bacterium CG12_big_fil_rev_8_21_14_0_65_45_16]